jgi:3-methyladenine DNA glycosylase AlkD
VEDIANTVTRALEKAGSLERAAWDKSYLKSDLEHWGVTLPALRAILAPFKLLPRAELLPLVDALWKGKIHDRRAAAVVLLEKRAKVLEPSDMDLVERLLRESKTWAFVDTLAVHVAGALVTAHPALAKRLDRWSKDDDFWLRRSAMLALLAPLRAGGGDFDRFGRYADAMLEEKEFFIRKAIGWILREVSKKRPELVASWLEPRAGRASGLTIREAIKHLPEADKATILKGSTRRPRR